MFSAVEPGARSAGGGASPSVAAPFIGPVCPSSPGTAGSSRGLPRAEWGTAGAALTRAASVWSDCRARPQTGEAGASPALTRSREPANQRASRNTRPGRGSKIAVVVRGRSPRRAPDPAPAVVTSFSCAT
jgi:hypothetical protein